ncbi:hypothetical protein [Nonomuraea polychroma]|uniref:hypothetical protein n=1 Tax=Nonomuraea polychroma TaxID=46176 RepID=UPI0019D42152|nr:hypothetical protein [Nonomuraea polychroma]
MISGVLTDLTSWRWIFLINLPVAVVALVLVSLVYGLLQAGESGWGEVAVIAPLLLAAVLTAGFLVAESRTAEPLVPMSFLADRTRAVAGGATLLFSAAFYAMAFLLMIHLQTVLGYGPLHAGVAYLPYGAGILVGMWLSAHEMGSPRPAAEGFSFALTVAAALLALGSILIAALLRTRRSASAPDTAAHQTPARRR